MRGDSVEDERTEIEISDRFHPPILSDQARMRVRMGMSLDQNLNPAVKALRNSAAIKRIQAIRVGPDPLGTGTVFLTRFASVA